MFLILFNGGGIKNKEQGANSKVKIVVSCFAIASEVGACSLYPVHGNKVPGFERNVGGEECLYYSFGQGRWVTFLPKKGILNIEVIYACGKKQI